MPEIFQTTTACLTPFGITVPGIRITLAIPIPNGEIKVVSDLPRPKKMESHKDLPIPFRIFRFLF